MTDRSARARRWFAAVLVPVGLVLVVGATAGAAAADTPFEECVATRMQAGDSRPEAMATCVRDEASPTTTLVRPRPDTDTDARASTGGDGTSIGLLLAAGAGGIVLGAGAVILLRSRGGAAAGAVTPGHVRSPAPVAPPPMFAPGPAAPSGGAPPSPAAPDRSPGLVASLVDLSDRVSSGALRAEIVAALARAGVHAIEPAQGDVFDVNRMRGVGSAPAPDPTWIGRVAGTERAGFQDGAATVRQPDVIVYTAAG